MQRRSAFLLALAVAAAACVPAAALRAADDSIRVELGPLETVLADGQLGLRYFPDERLAVVRTKPDCRVIVAAGVASFLLEGPVVGKFTKATMVLEKGGPGEFDNGYAGISAAVRARSGELLAFYHAEDQEGMKSLGSGIPGFYGRVALAVSGDDGRTFQKRGPVLSGQLAKDPGGFGDQGVGEPWVFAEPTGEFLYAYYTSHERVHGRGVDICMARCAVAEAGKTGAWRKRFRDGFTEPGLGGRDSPVVTGGRQGVDALLPQVVHVSRLRRFLMTFCVNAWRGGAGAGASGIYAAFSNDGIHWPRERMRLIWPVPTVPVLGRELAWHPTFIPDEGGGGAAGWLYCGYSERWGHQPPCRPHHLVRRRMVLREE